MLLPQSVAESVGGKRKGDLMVAPIAIADDWDHNKVILFGDLCELICTPQCTVRDLHDGASVLAGPATKVSADFTYRPPRPAASLPGPRPGARRGGPLPVRRAPQVCLSLEVAAEAMSASVKDPRCWIAADTLPAYRCGKRAIRVNLEDPEAAPGQVP